MLYRKVEANKRTTLENDNWISEVVKNGYISSTFGGYLKQINFLRGHGENALAIAEYGDLEATCSAISEARKHISEVCRIYMEAMTGDKVKRISGTPFVGMTGPLVANFYKNGGFLPHQERLIGIAKEILDEYVHQVELILYHKQEAVRNN